MGSEREGQSGSRFWKAVPERTLVIPQGLPCAGCCSGPSQDFPFNSGGSERGGACPDHPAWPWLKGLGGVLACVASPSKLR